MNATAAYFRDKAALCRRLADHLLNQDDPAVLTLRSMATECDANASALETQVAREAAHLSRDEKAPELH